MTDAAFAAGKRDGAHDAQRYDWLEWLAGTFERTPRNLDPSDSEQYLAGYLIGMTDRLREMTDARKVQA
jgi:hypothetical protein